MCHSDSTTSTYQRKDQGKPNQEADAIPNEKSQVTTDDCQIRKWPSESITNYMNTRTDQRNIKNTHVQPGRHGAKRAQEKSAKVQNLPLTLELKGNTSATAGLTELGKETDDERYPRRGGNLGM